MNLNEFRNNFISDCDIRGKSDLTIRSYDSELKKMVDYFSTHGLTDSDSLSTQTLREFFTSRSKSDNLSPVTVRKIMNVVRSLCKYGIRCRVFPESPMAHINSPRLPRKLPDYLTELELKQLMNSLDKNPGYSISDQALIRFLAGTGVRRAEVLGLQWSSVNLAEKYALIIGKGDKQRLIPLSDSLVKWLKILKRIPSTHNYVFTGRNGQPMNKDVLNKLIFKLSLDAGLTKHVTPHTFRRTFASHLILKGVPVIVAPKLLGHDSIQSTQIYTRVDISLMEKAVNKLSLD